MRHSLRPVLAVLMLAAACAASSQEQADLPIQLKAGSLAFDYEKGVVTYEKITITQGDVRITADRAVTNSSGGDFEDSRWEFIGAVRITTPESSIASETARVRFAAGEIQSATVTGTPATFQQQGEEQLSEGRANRIDYDLKRGTVELAGAAWLSDGRTEITGETLVYSTANQRVVSNEQVLITIQPGESQPEKPKPPS
jgi:lipopolysaccharide transport protein LptA